MFYIGINNKNGKSMDSINDSYEPHIDIVKSIIMFCFKQIPTSIQRIKIGISNEVYVVALKEKEVIVRMNLEKKYLMGSHDHIPKLKRLGIHVPAILAEDYEKAQFPFAYQIQSKIEGQDLGDVIHTLTESQLTILATEIASIFEKIQTIPSNHQFGLMWGGGDNDLSDSWTQRMKIWIDESIMRGKKTGIMDNDLINLANKLYEENKAYFDSVTPITYFGDMCSKNVMIQNGVLKGLVDLDGLTQGDPLEAIGRIKLSWYGTTYGKLYTDTVMSALHLDNDARRQVTVYALINQMSWMCENGIQFNLNTNTKVDKMKEAKDKALIKALMTELS